MARIEWTNEADTWLNEIHTFISQDNPAAAGRVIEEIYERTQILTEYPHAGHIYQTEPDGEIRILLYGHYRIAYQIKNDERIDILGVFHGALDINRYLL